MLGLGWKPFNEAEENKIKEAIQEAESKTSGEIRLHIDRYCKNDPLFKAKNKFVNLNMHLTKERNGVLIYVAMEEHKLAIVGDKGIDEKVGEGFWQDVKDLMIDRFKQGNYVEGLSEAIKLSGDKLAKYFPIQDDDKNELSDDISYG